MVGFQMHQIPKETRMIICITSPILKQVFKNRIYYTFLNLRLQSEKLFNMVLNNSIPNNVLFMRGIKIPNISYSKIYQNKKLNLEDIVTLRPFTHIITLKNIILVLIFHPS